MNIKNRIFTYPVLCKEDSAYNESTFDAKYEYNQRGTMFIDIKVVNELLCNDISDLIVNNKAKMYLHIECPNSAYRKLIEIEKNSEKKFEIDLKNINGKVELIAFVVTTETIYNYSSSDFNEDFCDHTFNIMKGSIIAYENLATMNVNKKNQSFEKIQSIFAVAKAEIEDGQPFYVDFQSDDDRIKINMSEELHSFYFNNSNNPKIQTLFNSMVVLPTLTFVLERMAINHDGYENRGWFMALQTYYRKRGEDFDEELEKIYNCQKESIIVAQEIMNSPINNAFGDLTALMSGGVENNAY